MISRLNSAAWSALALRLMETLCVSASVEWGWKTRLVYPALLMGNTVLQFIYNMKGLLKYPSFKSWNGSCFRSLKWLWSVSSLKVTTAQWWEVEVLMWEKSLASMMSASSFLTSQWLMEVSSAGFWFPFFFCYLENCFFSISLFLFNWSCSLSS